MVEHITDAEFEVQVLKSSGSILVDFFATWCGPCQLLAPVLDEIAPKTQTKIFKMDIEQNPNTPAKFYVQSVPCLVLFQDGKEIDRKTGFITSSDLLEWLNKKTT